MNKLAVLGFLILATTLEATGDAVVRIGIGHHAWPARCLLFLGGAALLFGYGLSLNLAPVTFGRVVGAYIALLFIVWQIINFIAFRSPPEASTYIGGAFILTGGMIVTFYGR